MQIFPVRGHRQRSPSVRALLSVALLVAMCGELAEALLLLGRGGPRGGRAAATAPLVAAACSVVSWLPCELLGAHLNRTQCRAMRLLPVTCGALLSAAR